MKTKYGLDYNILSKEEVERFEGYDRKVAECHITNLGYIIVDGKYGEPIDNENDLDQIYEHLNRQ